MDSVSNENHCKFCGIDFLFNKMTNRAIKKHINECKRNRELEERPKSCPKCKHEFPLETAQDRQKWNFKNIQSHISGCGKDKTKKPINYFIILIVIKYIFTEKS